MKRLAFPVMALLLLAGFVYSWDTSPPTITVNSPENKSYNITPVNLSITLSEDFSWVGYSLDGGDNVTLSGKVTTFNDSSASKVLTFSGAGSQYLYVDLPKNATVASFGATYFHGQLSQSGSGAGTWRGEKINITESFYLTRLDVFVGAAGLSEARVYDSATGELLASSGDVDCSPYVGGWCPFTFSNPPYLESGKEYILAVTGSDFTTLWSDSLPDEHYVNRSSVYDAWQDVPGWELRYKVYKSNFPKITLEALPYGTPTNSLKLSQTSWDSSAGSVWEGQKFIPENPFMVSGVEFSIATSGFYEARLYRASDNQLMASCTFTGSGSGVGCDFDTPTTLKGGVWYIAAVNVSANKVYSFSGDSVAWGHRINSSDATTWEEQLGEEIWIKIYENTNLSNITIDTGDDGVNDVSITGLLISSNIDLNATALQNAIDAGSGDVVTIPLNITTDSAAKVNLSGLGIKYLSTAILENLSEGSYNVTVYANDTVGNFNGSTVHFSVDLPPYRLDINSPANITVISSTVKTFNWTAYDTRSNLTSNLSIDGKVNIPNIATINATATTQSVSGLAEGWHNWSVTVWDEAGNTITGDTYLFLVDYHSIFEGLEHTLYSNGNVTRADFVSGSYQNISDSIAISFNQPSLRVIITDINNNAFKLIGVSSDTLINFTKANKTVELSGTLTYFNVTDFSSAYFKTYFENSDTLNLTITGLLDGTYTRVLDDQKSTINVTGGTLIDAIPAGTHKLTYTSGVFVEPPTPPSGGGGGYSEDLNFTTDITAAASVEAYQPFTIRVRLYISDDTITFDTPVIKVEFNGTEIGSWAMNYLYGSGNDITYERTLELPPGEFAYYIEVNASDGNNYRSSDYFINVYIPESQNTTYVQLPTYAPSTLLVTFTDKTTPKSNEMIVRSKGLVVSGLALNVNGTLTRATLFLLVEQGGTVITSVPLNYTDNGNGTFSLYGFTTLPDGYTRIAIQLGVEDSSGRGAYSVTRIIVLADEDTQHIAKRATDMYQNVIPPDRGSPEIPIGKYFVAALLGLGMMGIIFGSGAGAVPAIAVGVLAGAEFAIYGMAPGYIAIIGVLILALITVRVLINVFSGGQQR